MAAHSSSSSEQLEDEDVSLSDLPHIFIDPDQTTSTDPDNGNVVEAEEEFDFGASMRGSMFLADTKMCAADELFFKGQILPLRLSVSSDNNGLITKLNATQQRLSMSSRSDSTDQPGQCHMSSSFKSSRGSSTGISPNSSRSNSNSSTSTDTSRTTNTSIASLKPKRVANVVRNQFYAHPSPKPHIQISNGSRLENAGTRRSKKSSFSIWDFFRLGLVRTPEQDLGKLTLRSNSARVTSTRISVSRNSSVNSNNSTPLSNNNINATTSTIANVTTCHGEKGNVTNSTAMSKSEKSRQTFYNGCKCAFDDVLSSNAIRPKGIVDKESEVKHEKQAEKVKMKMKMKKDNGNKRKQVKQDMSNQRTYEWLKGL